MILSHHSGPNINIPQIYFNAGITNELYWYIQNTLQLSRLKLEATIAILKENKRENFSKQLPLKYQSFLSFANI